MEQLKKCPFCGSEAELVGDIYHWVLCKGCQGGSHAFETVEEAIVAWNTRTPMERVVERLEEQKEQYKRREKEHEGKNITVKLSEKYYGKACSYGHAIEIVKEEM